MIWLSHGIAAIVLLSVIFEYKLKYIDKDGRTVDHKRTRLIVLCIAILSILIQQVMATLEDSKRANAEAEFRNKVDIANTNIAKLGVQYSEMLVALSTNNAVDSKLRVEILEHSRAVELISSEISELERWKTDFRNQQSAAKRKQDAGRLRHQILLEEQRAAAKDRIDFTWKRSGQVFDFLIRTLQETIQSVAKPTGEKVFADYAGLPAAPFGDGSTHVASITTGTNLGWSFKISAEGIPRTRGAEVWLRVYGSCTNGANQVVYMTKIESSGAPENPQTPNLNAESHLWFTEKTHPEFSESIDLGSYQTNILACVRRFIAAHAIRCENQ